MRIHTVTSRKSPLQIFFLTHESKDTYYIPNAHDRHFVSYGMEMIIEVMDHSPKVQNTVKTKTKPRTQRETG